MEPRHLRYFIAVAEEGSLPVAAERRLHTAAFPVKEPLGSRTDELLRVAGNDH